MPKTPSYKRVKPVIKRHGGKYYLAPQLVELYKKCPVKILHRGETHGGGLSFTLASDPAGVSEFVNDIDGELTNFWRVLQREDEFEQFSRAVNAMPFSSVEFSHDHKCWTGHEWQNLKQTMPCVDCAIDFFVRCRQSMSGRLKDFTPLTRNRLRRGMNAEASAWIGAIDGLPIAHGRLFPVVVLNEDANVVIKQQDSKNTFFYADPGYVHSTRATKTEYGDHEMSDDQHLRLLNTLGDIKGKFLLSGYMSKMYEGFAVVHRWHCRQFTLPNNSAKGVMKQRKIECVWANYKI